MKQDLFKYRPSLYTPEALKKSLVGREALVKRLLKAIDEGRQRKGLQNFLLIGPRGIGKTHLLLLLHHSVQGTLHWQGVPDDLHDDWVSLLFPEETYRITSLADLLLEALNLIKDESPDAELLALIERCNRVSIPNEPERELLIDYLVQRKKRDGKRFLFLIDNLQNILPRFTEENQGRLRDLLMRGDLFMFIGTAPTLFKEVQDYEKPFYNFFEIVWIPEIKSDEIKTLIKTRLKMDRRTELLEKFDELQPRLDAVIHLTGGNPRLILSVYQIFVESKIIEVERTFLSLLDELTPYFQDRMSELAPQQQQILDAIASMDGSSTPTELAEAARLKVNVVTTQLRRLEKDGYVRSLKERGKKETLYDITERLLRLWRQMSVEAGRRRLRVIIKFLEAWFTQKEPQAYASKLAPLMLSKGLEYLSDILADKVDDTQEILVQYPKELLKIGQPEFLKQVLDQIEATGSADLIEFIKPYRAALRYYHTKDKAILNRLFPEIREIVEEMVKELEDSEDMQ